MNKRPVKWKPIWSRNVNGKFFLNSGVPDVIANKYRGTLLDEILAMPEKKPITFEKAINLAFAEFSKALFSVPVGDEPGQCIWYLNNFVRWISSRGYHIELTGDEFEPIFDSKSAA